MTATGPVRARYVFMVKGRQIDPAFLRACAGLRLVEYGARALTALLAMGTGRQGRGSGPWDSG